jgi:hypothetical protein
VKSPQEDVRLIASATKNQPCLSRFEHSFFTGSSKFLSHAVERAVRDEFEGIEAEGSTAVEDIVKPLRERRTMMGEMARISEDVCKYRFSWSV